MKELCYLLLSCLLGLSGLRFASADEVVYSRSLVCRRTSSPPKIDGNLDENAWKGAPEATNFISLGTRDVPEVKPAYPVEDQTTVRALYDDKCIYFGIECRAPEGDKFRMIKGGRDVNFLSAESVEIVLSARPETGSARQFAVNPENTQLDAELRNGGFDTAWKATWQSAVSGGPGKWAVELAVPLDALAADLASTGAVWSVNVRRNHSGWHQMSAWSNPVEPHLTDVRTYGHLLLLDPAHTPSLASLSCPLLAPWGHNAVRLQTDQPARIGLLSREAETARQIEAPAGKPVVASVPIPQAGRTALQLKGLGQACRFSIWSRDLLSLRLERILSAKQDKTVSGRLRISAKQDLLKTLAIKARLVDGKGKSVEKMIGTPDSPEIRISLPLGDLSPGVCRFQVEPSEPRRRYDDREYRARLCALLPELVEEILKVLQRHVRRNGMIDGRKIAALIEQASDLLDLRVDLGSPGNQGPFVDVPGNDDICAIFPLQRHRVLTSRHFERGEPVDADLHP
jgi:hypothetical protein